MKIGEKIRRLRMKHNLTQEELADRCELTKGFISQVERELTSPSIATLVDILESLGTNLRDFFNDDVEEKIVFSKKDVFVKTDAESGSEIHWIIPNAQKNVMEPIVVVLEAGGRTPLDDPHEGEEFGYVLRGSIILHLGSEEFKVRSGESFYFRPSTSHYIVNAGTTAAKVLWVASPPSF
ncbi:MAG TPA: cupin domain-containing protein [Firmicutes bacterium]|jgi:transcriptional regulator with XRE-family HTH domain|nr:MAG: Cro/Cl family transcriptional regulator [Peptococcaceae bacterium 1109]HHT73962.1 cupin domain-containing protein [Bacillota bacterium]